jgi:hypothetical protein
MRVLGTDVLYDEWRAVTEEEVNAAHHYLQKILEHFCNDSSSVAQTAEEFVAVAQSNCGNNT